MSGGSASPEALAAVIMAAKADDFTVVTADAHTLLLDLDTPEALKQFKRVLPIVQEHFGAGTPEKWKSKSGNTHVRIPLDDETPYAVRYMLQAALGSDGVREALHMVQIYAGCVEPCVLFKPPAKRKGRGKKR